MSNYSIPKNEECVAISAQNLNIKNLLAFLMNEEDDEFLRLWMMSTYGSSVYPHRVIYSLMYWKVIYSSERIDRDKLFLINLIKQFNEQASNDVRGSSLCKQIDISHFERKYSFQLIGRSQMFRKKT